MSEYNNDELMHYGVPGMQWGKRKALPVSSAVTNISRAKSAIKARKNRYLGDGRSDAAFDKAYNSTYNKLTKSGMRRGKAESKAMDAAIKSAGAVDKKVHAEYKSDMKRLKANYKQAKKERRTAINDTYKKIQKNATFGEKLLWNDATRQKAAKYVVDNKMSVADAKNKASGEAIRNTAVLLAAVGGYSAYKYLKNR